MRQKLTSDTHRLEWVIERRATIDRRFRMLTRQGGLEPANLQQVFCVNWYAENGDNIEQSVDNDHRSMRDAIDAAMGLGEKEEF